MNNIITVVKNSQRIYIQQYASLGICKSLIRTEPLGINDQDSILYADASRNRNTTREIETLNSNTKLKHFINLLGMTITSSNVLFWGQNIPQ